MEARDERGEIKPTSIAGEHSLTLYVGKRESIYKQAGAVHDCALCKGAENLMLGEDVGRHNAVDAIAGIIGRATGKHILSSPANTGSGSSDR